MSIWSKRQFVPIYLYRTSPSAQTDGCRGGGNVPAGITVEVRSRRVEGEIVPPAARTKKVSRHLVISSRHANNYPHKELTSGCYLAHGLRLSGP